MRLIVAMKTELYIYILYTSNSNLIRFEIYILINTINLKLS